MPIRILLLFLFAVGGVQLIHAAPTDWDKTRAEWDRKRAQNAQKYGNKSKTDFDAIRKRLKNKTRTLPVRNSARPKNSKLYAEYQRRVKQKEQQRAKEKAKADQGPSPQDVLQAGHPAEVAKQYLKVARNAKTPSQLKLFLTEERWKSYQNKLKQFDPALAKSELNKVAGRDDSKAELVRRIHMHPTKDLLLEHREIGNQVKTVSKIRLHPRDKFKVIVTGHVLPAGTKDDFGNDYPTASLTFVLENGRWKFDSYKFSVTVFRF